MQIKTMRRHHFTPLRTARIKKTELVAKTRRKWIIYLDPDGGNVKLMSLLWKTSWWFLRLSELRDDPAIALRYNPKA